MSLSNEALARLDDCYARGATVKATVFVGFVGGEFTFTFRGTHFNEMGDVLRPGGLSGPFTIDLDASRLDPLYSVRFAKGIDGEPEPVIAGDLVGTTCAGAHKFSEFDAAEKDVSGKSVRFTKLDTATPVLAYKLNFMIRQARNTPEVLVTYDPRIINR